METDAPSPEAQKTQSGEELFSREVTPGSLPAGAPQIHRQHHDCWLWHALYDDGTKLTEVEGDTLHAFSEIDQDRLVGFVLLPTLEGWPQYGVQLNREKRLYFCRRRKLSYNPNTEEVTHSAWHVLGYTTEGQSGKQHSLLHICQNGDAFISDEEHPEYE